MNPRKKSSVNDMTGQEPLNFFIVFKTFACISIVRGFNPLSFMDFSHIAYQSAEAPRFEYMSCNLDNVISPE